MMLERVWVLDAVFRDIRSDGSAAVSGLRDSWLGSHWMIRESGEDVADGRFAPGLFPNQLVDQKSSSRASG